MKKEGQLIPPDIPVIYDDELKSAVSALANSGNTYRKLFLMLAGGDATLDEIFGKHLQVLMLADQVLEKWLDELQLNDLERPDASQEHNF